MTAANEACTGHKSFTQATMQPGAASLPASVPRAGPLVGVRVLELRGIGPIPFAAMLLADLGADILQVAPPGTPQDEGPTARGRSRLALDLKQPAHRDVLLDILPHTDVLIEGFRPGAMERLGLGPRDCLAHQPRLVYGRMTGWGQDGPLAALPCHDPNVLALTGVLHSIGDPASAPRPPLNLVADLGGGALYLTTGVLAALLQARATGLGQVVDAAMVDGVASLMSGVHALRAQGQWRDERGVNFLDGSCPFGTSYLCADGKYLLICPVEPPFYARLLEGLGLQEEPLPAQYDRSGWPRLGQRFAQVIATRTRDEWAARLEGIGACASPVLDLAEAPRHPHLVARQVYDEHGQPGVAPRFQGTPTLPAPSTLGDPVALLARWGASSELIARVGAVAPAATGLAP